MEGDDSNQTLIENGRPPSAVINTIYCANKYHSDPTVFWSVGFVFNITGSKVSDFTHVSAVSQPKV